MLIEEIDGVNLKPLERSLDRLLDVIRLALGPTNPGLSSGLS
jgi:hypothetical protein